MAELLDKAAGMTARPATAGADSRIWPEPYLQPDRTQDCGYYAQAYQAPKPHREAAR